MNTSIPAQQRAAASFQTLTARTLSGLFWVASGNAVHAALQLAIVLILARLLTPQDFGLVSAAIVIISFLSIFSYLGIGPAIVQRKELEERHRATGFVTSLAFGLLSAVLLCLTAPAITHLMRVPGLSRVLCVLSLDLPIMGAGVVAESLLQREMQFRRIAGITVIGYGVGYGLLGVTLAWMGFGVWALVWGTLAQDGIRCVLLLLQSSARPILRFERKAFTDLLYFGGGFTLARLFNNFALRGDNLVVGRWLGAEALGFYGRAYQLLSMPAILFGYVLDKALFPAIAKVQDDPPRLLLAYRRGVALIALGVLPLSVLFWILAPEWIDVLLGRRWMPVVVPFQIFAVGMLFRTSYKMSDCLARSTGVVYSRAWRQGIYALLVVAGAWGGQHWGLAGVSLGVLCALTINFFLMAQLSLRVCGMTWRMLAAAHLPALLLSGIAAVEVLAIARLLREIGTPAYITLLIPSIVLLLTLLCIMRYCPVLLGKEGQWLLRTLTGYLHPGSRRKPSAIDQAAGDQGQVLQKGKASGPLVIEFVGLPGAGKSTIARLLAARLHTLGYQCLLHGEVNKAADQQLPLTYANGLAKAGRMATASFLLRNAALIMHTCWFTLHVKPVTIERFRRAIQCLKKYGAVHRLVHNPLAKQSYYLIFDQSLLQAIWSILVFGNPPAERLLMPLIKHCRAHLGSVIVYVMVDSDTASHRIEARPRQKHRFELMQPDEVCRELETYTACLDGLVAIARDITGSRVIRLENVDCLQTTVDRVVEQVIGVSTET